MPSSGARLQLAAIEASREWERSGDPCDPIVLLQRCGEDDAAAELWGLKTQQSPRTTTPRCQHLISLFAESDNCGAPTTQPARLRA